MARIYAKSPNTLLGCRALNDDDWIVIYVHIKKLASDEKIRTHHKFLYRHRAERLDLKLWTLMSQHLKYL